MHALRRSSFFTPYYSCIVQCNNKMSPKLNGSFVFSSFLENNTSLVITLSLQLVKDHLFLKKKSKMRS